MTSMPNLDLGLNPKRVIDARHTDGPITLVKLNHEIKAAPLEAVLSILTMEASAEENLRSFCRSTGNQYLECDHQDGYDIHWIKKIQATTECATCSSVRTLLSGVITVGVLAYTAPLIVSGGESTITTILFILSLCALPPVAYDSFRLALRTSKRLTRSPDNFA
jgi:TusA-related sulfurtransferase